MKSATEAVKRSKIAEKSGSDKQGCVDHFEFRGLLVVPFGQDEYRDQELKRIWAAPSKSQRCGR